MNFAEPWQGTRRFIVDQKIKESEVITSFYLVPEDGKPLAYYQPGQYLIFELDIPDQSSPVIRSYTISDAPNTRYYRLSIKKEPPPQDQPNLPPGLSSNYFHDHVHKGSILKAKSPKGDFFLQGETSPVVFLSGGVGQTPMLSMLNYIVEHQKRNVWFIHGAINSTTHAFNHFVRATTEQFNYVNSHVVYSNPLASDELSRHYHSQGFITTELLESLTVPKEADFYMCGPPPFMQSIFNQLIDWGIPENKIFYEFFGIAKHLKYFDSVEEMNQKSAENISITFSKSGLTVDWDTSATSILEFAESQGLSPDFGCRAGACHACECTLVEGEIEYLAGGKNEAEPEEILICCSKPTKSVVIDI